MKKREMYFEVETISPDQAREYLRLNVDHNRMLSLVKIHRFAEAMKAGKWRKTYEPIAFDWDGNLLNGQHRLNAVIEAGVPIEFTLAHNCDPEQFAVIDQGGRTAADVFTIMFKKKFGEAPIRHQLMAAVSSAMLQGLGGSAPHDKEKIADTALKHQKLIGDYVNSMRKTHVYNAKTTAAWCNAAVYFSRAKIDPLMERFEKTMWANERDPLKALYERLLKGKLKESRQHLLEGRDHYGLTIAAIRAALLGQNRSRLETTSQEVGEADIDRRIRNAANPKQLRESEATS